MKTWGLADDTSDVLAFDKKGQVIFLKFGKLTEPDIQQPIEVIRNHPDE